VQPIPQFERGHCDQTSDGLAGIGPGEPLQEGLIQNQRNRLGGCERSPAIQIALIFTERTDYVHIAQLWIKLSSISIQQTSKDVR
jgi:hypothetical protein